MRIIGAPHWGISLHQCPACPHCRQTDSASATLHSIFASMINPDPAQFSFSFTAPDSLSRSGLLPGERHLLDNCPFISHSFLSSSDDLVSSHFPFSMDSISSSITRYVVALCRASKAHHGAIAGQVVARGRSPTSHHGAIATCLLLAAHSSLSDPGTSDTFEPVDSSTLVFSFPPTRNRSSSSSISSDTVTCFSVLFVIWG